MRRTLSIGSCASMPMLALLERVTSSNPNMEITAEIKSDDLLLQGLAQHKYQLIILPHIAEEPDFTYQECGQEQLMAALPQDHSLANITPFTGRMTYSDYPGYLNKDNGGI